MSFSGWKKILKASFFGLIFGMIAGIFLAPEKGMKAREKMKKRCRDWKKKIVALAEKAGVETKKISYDVKEAFRKGEEEAEKTLQKEDKGEK